MSDESIPRLKSLLCFVLLFDLGQISYSLCAPPKGG
jgi:hypothetical protein